MVERYRSNQYCSDHDELPVTTDVEQDEAVVNHSEDQDTNQRATDPTDPTSEARTPQNDCSNDSQTGAAGAVGKTGADRSGEHNASNGREEPRDRIDATWTSLVRTPASRAASRLSPIR